MADKSDVVTSISLEFKDMDVWVAEQEAKAAAEEAKKKANSKPIEPATAPPAKKAKNVVDIEALAVERLAVEEMGDTNWIGLLQRKKSSSCVCRFCLPTLLMLVQNIGTFIPWLVLPTRD